LFNVKGANFQLYHGDNKLHFDEMMFALYLVNIRRQQSTRRHVAPPKHIILITSKPVFALAP
jgi:hypothetical protein